MGRGDGLDRPASHASRCSYLGLSMHTGDIAMTWWLLMIAPGLIGAILGFSFTGNARGLVAGAILGPLATITLLIFGGSANSQSPDVLQQCERDPSFSVLPSARMRSGAVRRYWWGAS